jgi:hypothetical protein
VIFFFHSFVFSLVLLSLSFPLVSCRPLFSLLFSVNLLLNSSKFVVESINLFCSPELGWNLLPFIIMEEATGEDGFHKSDFLQICSSSLVNYIKSMPVEDAVMPALLRCCERLGRLMLNR